MVAKGATRASENWGPLTLALSPLHGERGPEGRGGERGGRGDGRGRCRPVPVPRAPGGGGGGGRGGALGGSQPGAGGGRRPLPPLLNPLRWSGACLRSSPALPGGG